jgi:hypothetical protein
MVAHKGEWTRLYIPTFGSDGLGEVPQGFEIERHRLTPDVQLNKCVQLVVGVHNEVFSVAVRARNKDSITMKRPVTEIATFTHN